MFLPYSIHYRSNVWGHLEMSLFLSIKIDQKYKVDIVNVVIDYCSWKRLIFMEYLHTVGPFSETITPVFQWHVVLANPCLLF